MMNPWKSPKGHRTVLESYFCVDVDLNPESG